MQLLTNIQWDHVPCHLCGNVNHFAPLKAGGRPLIVGQFGYAIFPTVCRCGLVMLNPRWSKKDYDIFYQSHYDSLYRLDMKPDHGIEGIIGHMKTVWSRVGHMLESSNAPRILDAGAGSGAGLAYLGRTMKSAQLAAIESSAECARSLADHGIELVASDLESNWSDAYEGSFDLIIFRHVVEHLLDPVATLAKLRKTLAPNGILYIATPDMMRPRTVLRDYAIWWEYWFRPVHVYYFSNDTFNATLAKAGLTPTVMRNEDEEIWCAAKKCTPNDSAFRWCREEQLEALARYSITV